MTYTALQEFSNYLILKKIRKHLHFKDLTLINMKSDRNVKMEMKIKQNNDNKLANHYNSF